MSTLEDLVNRGLIEGVEPDQATATQWLDDAGRHLDAAHTIADLDPCGAYVLAYDAARKSVAAALLVAGYRVRSRPRAHQALAEYAQYLATQASEPALKHLDRLRRNRNQSEYGSRNFGKAEVAEAIDIARSIRSACTGFL